MPGLSTYLTGKLLDHTLRNISYTSPTTVYLALFTVLPADDGTGGTEVAGGSYARLAATFVESDQDGITYNAAAIQFDVPACTIVGGAIYDHVSAGNMLWVARFTSPKAAAAGTFTVSVGDLWCRLR